MKIRKIILPLKNQRGGMLNKKRLFYLKNILYLTPKNNLPYKISI